MKILVWVALTSLVFYTAVLVASGAPVFQDEGQRSQIDEFPSNGPDSHPGRVSLNYSKAPPKMHLLSTLQELVRSRDSTARLSQQESNKLGKNQELQNHLVTGLSHASSHTQDSKIRLIADRVRHVQEAHTAKTTATEDPPDTSLLDVTSHEKKLYPFKFFEQLDSLRKKVYELADKIEELKTSGDDLRTSLLELQTDSHSSVPLHNLSEDSSETVMQELNKNDSKNLGFYFIGWNVTNPDPLLPLIDEVSPHHSAATDDFNSFFRMVSYLRNKQTERKNGHQAGGVLTTTSPVDNKDHFTNNPDKRSRVIHKIPSAIDPNLKPVDKLKEFLAKMAYEDKYEDVPIKYYDDQDINQDPKQFLKLSEELRRWQKHVTRNEASLREMPDSGSSVSPSVVLDSAKTTSALPADVESVSLGPVQEPAATGLAHSHPSSTELYDMNPTEKVVVDGVKTSTGKHETDPHSLPTDKEPIDTSPSIISVTVEPTDAGPFDVENDDGEPIYVDRPDIETVNVESTTSDPMNLTSVITEHAITSASTGPILLHPVVTESALEPAPTETVNMMYDAEFNVEPTSTEPITMEPSTTELSSIEPEPSTTEPSSIEPEPSTTEPSSIEPEPSTTEPSSIEPEPSTTELSSIEPEPSTTEPSSIEPEPSTTEPSSIEPEPSTTEPSSTKETYVMFDISGPVSMEPTIREPIDQETTAIASVSVNYFPPDSTSMGHVTMEPPVTQSSNPGMTPKVVITIPLTHASSEPGAAVQETTLATTHDEQTASKIAQEGVEKTSVQYHDHTVLLVGLLVTGVSFVMVFIGASILCRVHQKKRELQERADTEYLKPRYTRHNPLARQ
ncbi:uncharacterized protein [Panulirus ornatus]|uniref:uncharacterized protein n=1 Tax=Panulirus ornatus TaxID=150431 RepID=UPI003A83F849